MPHLTIGDRVARYPIVQGGMAVRISLAPLAAAVARAGGVGIIAGTGLEPDELAQQLRTAREITDGVVGVNILVAVRAFKELVQTALREGADFIVAGAGFSRDMFEWCSQAHIPAVPIVGSVRVAKLAERFGAAAVIVEGVEAGGHLGTDRPMEDLLPEIIDAVDIPVIGAGGVVSGGDIKRVLDMGAAGVQMGSRFAATMESSAPDDFKRMYVDATEDDIVLIQSPVGLPGRALRNAFTTRLLGGEDLSIDRCIACLKHCGRDFCIMDKLLRAQRGDVTDGLVFAGSSAARIHDIPTVAEVFDRLIAEWNLASAGGATA